MNLAFGTLSSHQVSNLPVDSQALPCADCTQSHPQSWYSMNQWCYINRIPVDRIADILSYTVACERENRQVPTSLALVCREWLHITKHFKSLWSYIYLDSKCTDEQVPLYLGRSGDTPLTISILDGYQLHHAYGYTVFKPLCEQSNRWKSLHVEQTHFNAFMRALRRYDCTLPLLTYLNVDLLRYDSIGIKVPFRNTPRWLFQIAQMFFGTEEIDEATISEAVPHFPALRILKISTRCSFSRFPKNSIQPLLTVTTLDISIHPCVIHEFDFWKVLAELPILKDLRLTGLFASPGFAIGRQLPVKLPNLSSILLKGNLQFIASFLPILDCPLERPIRLCLEETQDPHETDLAIYSFTLPLFSKVNQLCIKSKGGRDSFLLDFPRIFTVRSLLSTVLTSLEKDASNKEAKQGRSLQKIELEFTYISESDIKQLVRVSQMVCSGGLWFQS